MMRRRFFIPLAVLSASCVRSSACQKIPAAEDPTRSNVELSSTASQRPLSEVPRLLPKFGIYRAGTFGMRSTLTTGFSELSVLFGLESDIPLMGDWDGNGTITIGVYRPSESTFYLRNTNGAGSPDIVVRFGSAESLPVVGDWDGDGKATIGTFDRSRAIFSLLNTNAAYGKPLVVPFGQAGDWPVTGDWDGDGKTTIGVFRRGTFYLRNSN